MKTKICSRCNNTYNTCAKYSKICEGCKRPVGGWRLKELKGGNDKNG